MVLLQANDLYNLVDNLGPTWAVAITFVFILYQFYSPEWLPETKVQSIIMEIRRDFTVMRERQLAHIQVTRAIASVENPSEEIDPSVVDNYLIENGVEKSAFFTDEEPDFSELSDTEIRQLISSLEDDNMSVKSDVLKDNE